MADGAGAMALSRLHALRAEARGLRSDLDRFLAKAGPRLAAERADADLPGLPPGTDWRARPVCLTAPIFPAGLAGVSAGTRLCDGVALWHDQTPAGTDAASAAPIILRQTVEPTDSAPTPYGLQLETFDFTGSFLSLSVDLRADVLAGLSGSNILRVDLNLTLDQPLSIYARMNVGHGPNIDEVHRHVGQIGAGAHHELVAEFDLYLVDMNELRLEKLWLDLIFERPANSRIVLHDLFLSRHLRAEL